MRLIDADALIASIHGSLQELRNIYEMFEDGEKKIICNSQIITLLETLFRVREQPTVDAVEVNRLGRLGRLMMPYKGCPRGRMGEAGDAGSEMGIRELDPVTDIEGDVWIPVLAEDLRRLKDKVCKPVVHGRWKYFHKQNIAVCTNCSFERNLDTNFGKAVSCPNCGARMDGDGNSS